jgi:hypothetical protein
MGTSPVFPLEKLDELPFSKQALVAVFEVSTPFEALPLCLV